MGSQNVKTVYALWWHLPHRPFRLLVYMASATLDEPVDGKAARLYWGGQEPLALAIGRPAPAAPHPDDESVEAQEARRQRKLAFEAVRTDVKTLINVGALERLRVGGFGGRSEYRLTLTQTLGQPGSTRPTSRSSKSTRPDLNQGLQTRPEPGPVDPGSARGTDPTSARAQLQGTSTGLRETTPSSSPPPGDLTSAREKSRMTDDEYDAAVRELIPRGPDVHDLVNQVMATHGIDRREAVIEVARTLRKKGTAA